MATTIRIKPYKTDNRFGGRNADISLGSSRFRGPYRTATQKDFFAASAMPFNITISNAISEIVSDFNNQDLDAFLSGNGSYQYRKSRIENQCIDMMRYSPIISTFQIPLGRRIPQDKLMRCLSMQNNSQISVISLPPFNYTDISDFEKIVVDYSEKARERGQEVMPILPLSTEIQTFNAEFRVLRILHNTGICNIIGFRYANLDANISQLEEIHRHRDEDIWYHCHGIPRTPPGRSNMPVAHIHELQNYGLDTFCPKVRQLGVKQVKYLVMKSQSTRPDEIQCQRFDSLTLGILKEPFWIKRYSYDLHCGCPVCKGKDLPAFKENYSHELNGEFNSNLLHNAERVHELSSGTDEFTVSRKAIESDDLPAYFTSKEFTRGRVRPPR